MGPKLLSEQVCFFSPRASTLLNVGLFGGVHFLLWRNCDKRYIDLGEKDHSKIGTVVGNEPTNMIQQTFAKEQGLKKRFLFYIWW